MMAITPNLQTMTERAQGIYKLLTDGFDCVQAKKEAKTLYQEGLTHLQAEVESKAIIGDPLSPVMIKLSEVVSLETIQQCDSLHRSLGKVYRLFIELCWYQSVKNLERPLYTQTQEKIQAAAKDIQKVLLKKTEIAAEFEYACAKQAAKCFNVSESTWEKYAMRGIRMSSAAVDHNTLELLNGSLELFKDFEKSQFRSWYFECHSLRWKSTLVKGPLNFNKLVQPHIDECRSKGGRHATCLTIVFMEIIKNSETKPKLRDHLVRGDGSNPGLVHIVTWEHNGLEDMLRHPSEAYHRIARKADRFWQARQLAMKYLHKLAASKVKFISYRDDCIQAICGRIDTLKERHEKRFQHEKIHYQSMAKGLKKKLEELSGMEVELEDKIALLSEASRSSAEDEEKLKAALEAIDSIVKEKEEAKTLIKQADENFERIEQLEKMENDELKQLESLVPEEKKGQ